MKNNFLMRKDRLIFCLFCCGLALFAVIHFYILPQQEARTVQYAQAQDDALTHDFTEILQYQSAYMGDASNIGNLFYHLPLHSIAMTFSIDSDQYLLTINYEIASEKIDSSKLKRDLLYNTTAAMTLIENLAAIDYQFSDQSISFSRTQLENIYGTPLSFFREETLWKEQVQAPLKDDTFIAQFFSFDL